MADIEKFTPKEWNQMDLSHEVSLDTCFCLKTLPPRQGAIFGYKGAPPSMKFSRILNSSVF